MVVATVTGKWVVLHSRTKEIHGVHQDGAEPINCVKFSPDGSKLAISSRAAIHVYRVEERDGNGFFQGIGGNICSCFPFLLSCNLFVCIISQRCLIFSLFLV